MLNYFLNLSLETNISNMLTYSIKNLLRPTQHFFFFLEYIIATQPNVIGNKSIKRYHYRNNLIIS